MNNNYDELLRGKFTSAESVRPRKYYKQKDATPEIVYMIIKKRLPKVQKVLPSVYSGQLEKLQQYSYLQKLSKDKLNKIRKRVLFLYNTQQLEEYKTNVINEMLREQREFIKG